MNPRRYSTSLDAFIDRSAWESRLWKRATEDTATPPTAGSNCLLWDGGTSNDFGLMYVKTKTGPDRAVYVHRLAFLLKVGPIPEHMTLTHLCGQHRCINVEHLELKSRASVLGSKRAEPSRKAWSTRIPFQVEMDTDLWTKGKELARRRGMPLNMLLESLLKRELESES